MAEINLTQAEAERLMTMEKHAADRKEWMFPGPGDRVNIPLISSDKREHFLLDVNRYQLRLTKATLQTRAHISIILYRLDIGGPPHTNPDGHVIPCPHLHIYREGYADKWATPASLDSFPDTTDLFSTLYAFMKHCNVTEPPKIEKSLFS